MNLQTTKVQTAEISPKVSETRRIIGVMFSRWVVVVGLVILASLIVIAIFAPFVARYSPNAIDPSIALQQPSLSHLLGTDQLGRDELSRMIYGTRISILVGVVAVSIAGVIGVTIGLAAGYFGGWTNSIVMRITDTLMCLPPLVLALAVAAALGGGLANIMISIGISLVPTYCRLMAAQALSIRENDYVTASYAMGGVYT